MSRNRKFNSPKNAPFVRKLFYTLGYITGVVIGKFRTLFPRKR